jgi:hypothetical protein
MAYKVLCDERGLYCDVVRGRVDGRRYAWNIVAYDGEYYHIDPARCDYEGFEHAFFRTDAQMRSDGYEWGASGYPVCAGSVTYKDIAGIAATGNGSGGTETPAETGG